MRKGAGDLISYTSLCSQCQHNRKVRQKAKLFGLSYVYVVYIIKTRYFSGGNACRDDRTLTWKAEF